MDTGSDPVSAETQGTVTPIRGYFQRPLFDAEAIRGLRRVGVIDVGSNSIRTVPRGCRCHRRHFCAARCMALQIDEGNGRIISWGPFVLRS